MYGSKNSKNSKPPESPLAFLFEKLHLLPRPDSSKLHHPLVVRNKLAYRQTEGFLHSIASLLGLGIEIPDYSTLCRRSRLLRKKLRSNCLPLWVDQGDGGVVGSTKD